jgi:recombination protein RecA
MYGEGISREGDLSGFSRHNNIVEKSGAWFSMKARGSDKDAKIPKIHLRKQGIFDRIENAVKIALGLVKAESVGSAVEVADII